MTEIDPRSVIAPTARIGKGVKIGAYAVVGDDVELGDGCVLDHHAMVQGPTRLGPNNRVYPFAAVGGDPQDVTFKGEPVWLEAGEGNTFREFCTVNRGTVKGGGVTRVGNHNLIMSYVHIGHDGQIGNNTIFVNNASLAGHVSVEDFATIGPFCQVHQFCRIGKFSYMGANSIISMDVLPFSIVVTPRATKCYGSNKVGLERNGFSSGRVTAVEQAYRLLLRSKLNTSQALAKMRETLADSEDVQSLVRFIESAERGFIK